MVESVPPSPATAGEGTGVRATSATGLVYDERYLAHDPGPMTLGSPPRFYPYADLEPHVEHPLRVGRVKELLDQGGLTQRLTPVRPWPAEAEDIGLFHTRDYIRRVIAISAATTESADVGAGARVTRGSCEVALLAAGGAIAAVHALRRNRAERVLIVDWDVHHGNGTQEAFYGDRRVLFVSLHQEGLYPE